MDLLLYIAQTVSMKWRVINVGNRIKRGGRSYAFGALIAGYGKRKEVGMYFTIYVKYIFCMDFNCIRQELSQCEQTLETILFVLTGGDRWYGLPREYGSHATA